MTKIKKHLTGRWAQLIAGPALAVLVVLMIQGGLIGATRSYDVGLAAVYGIVVLSMSLLAGWGGVWSVGQPALFAIGAYTAVHGSSHGWSLELIVLVACGLGALTGGFLGFAGARFSVLYISLLTLAFNLVVLEIIGMWQSLTGGDQGMPVDVLESVFGPTFSSASGGVNAVIILFGIVLAIGVLVRGSVLRMRLVAAKSHPVAARTVGIAPELQTALAFAVSGAFAALAGIGLAGITGYVSPETFGLTFAVNIIAAAVLGGIGSLAGGVVGGAFLAIAPTIASSTGIALPVLQGAILILVLLFLPKGVVPSLAALGRSLLRRLAPDAAAELVDSMPEIDDHHIAGSNGKKADKELERREGGAVEISDLTVRFGGLTALEDVSVDVQAGEVLGIIGPNGAGKTTLINTLSGLSSGGKISGTVRYKGDNLLKKRATAPTAYGHRARVPARRALRRADDRGEHPLRQAASRCERAPNRFETPLARRSRRRAGPLPARAAVRAAEARRSRSRRGGGSGSRPPRRAVRRPG